MSLQVLILKQNLNFSTLTLTGAWHFKNFNFLPVIVQVLLNNNLQ